MPETAVSILRVSTKKQLNEGEGIENQRRGNADYIRRRGYRLVREFVIAETADDREREDFETAIAQIVERRHEIDVVVFWKVDRISRGGVLPYYTLKGVLAKHGIRVEFATEQIDASASGELMETLLAGMARFENRLRVERTIGAERILTRDGYWCRAAPTGFRNGRLDGKPILLPTEEAGQWELLRYGLRKQLAGVHPQAAIAAELRAKGLRSSRGNLLGKQTWLNICRSPVYGGLLHGEWTDGTYVRAKFDGPLTPEEWQELQRVLDGRQPVAAPPPRQALHPDFPLRRFLRCPRCGRSARGYYAVGRHGRRFAYYDCQRPECGFRVPVDEAHRRFVRLMAEVTPAEPLLALFREVVHQVWDDHQRELDAGHLVGRTTVAQKEEEKAQLLTLMKRLANNPALLAELERDFERVEGELSLATVAAEDAGSDIRTYDKEEVVDLCVRSLSRVGELWQEWPVEAQSRLQRLVLPQGIPYDALTGSRTPELSLLYGVFPNVRGLKSRMAPPACRVSNRALLEALIAWYECFRNLPDLAAAVVPPKCRRHSTRDHRCRGGAGPEERLRADGGSARVTPRSWRTKPRASRHMGARGHPRDERRHTHRPGCRGGTSADTMRRPWPGARTSSASTSSRIPSRADSPPDSRASRRTGGGDGAGGHRRRGESGPQMQRDVRPKRRPPAPSGALRSRRRGEKTQGSSRKGT